MSDFKNRVIQIISKIPYGHVMSYGQIANYAGAPRSAREVGWILNQSGEELDVPWWRVVNNTGRISIKGSRVTPQMMKELLEKEGVVVNEDLTFDMEAYRYIPTIEELKKWGVDEKYLEVMKTEHVQLKF